jgi:hypothetical protein
MHTSSHVGPVIIGDFLQEKEAVPEEFGGQQTSSTAEINFPFEQGKPQCK